MNTRNIEKYSDVYASGELDFENILVKYRRKKVLEILEKYKPSNVLEIGCGYDSIVNYYKTFDSFTVVEPSEKFISEAIRNDNKNIKVYVDFLENKTDELKKNSYDFIILSSLLHEVPNVNNFMQHVADLCSKDTVLHINVPNSRAFHLLWAYESGLIKKLDELTPSALKLQQNTPFNSDLLTQAAEENGFHILEKGSYFIKPFNHSKMLQLVNENIIDEKLLDGLYNMVKYMPDMGSEIFINCRLK